MAPEGAPDDIKVSPMAIVETISIAAFELSRVPEREDSYFISLSDILDLVVTS